VTQRNRAFVMAAAPSITAPRADHPLPRVLIVEDELLVAWHLESLSREQNLEVCGLVPDGDGAIEQAVDLDVDLILMDIRLAGQMDGIEAARRIREQRDTPIIFITAHGDATTRAKIEMVLPGTPVLAKPITADSLKEAIASVMKT
jgi:CheY-like chemotaxis protein